MESFNGSLLCILASRACLPAGMHKLQVCPCNKTYMYCTHSVHERNRHGSQTMCAVYECTMSMYTLLCQWVSLTRITENVSKKNENKTLTFHEELVSASRGWRTSAMPARPQAPSCPQQHRTPPIDRLTNEWWEIKTPWDLSELSVCIKEQVSVHVPVLFLRNYVYSKEQIHALKAYMYTVQAMTH